MDIDYADAYRDLYERHWWWRAREAYVLAALRRHEPPGGWTRILDVGCGDGLLFPELGRFGAVEGVEPDAAMIGPGSPHRARIHVGPFDDTFVPGNRYSLILMLDVLEHVREPQALLRRGLELLEPEGTLLVTVPAFLSIWTAHDELNEHVTRYTRGRLVDLARGVGIEVLDAHYFFHWLFAAKLATRLYERVVRATPSVPTVPAGWLNRALLHGSRLEAAVLGRLPVPFGSSLMLVGRHPGH